MAKRRSRKSSSRRGSSNAGWYLAIVLCIGVVIGVAVLANNLISKGKIDEATLCHLTADLNVTAVLLDLTDPLNPTQQSRLKNILSNEISDSSVDTMISIGVVSEAPSKWGAQFARCKPASGDDANALYENPKIIANRYIREFIAPMNATLERMLGGEVENQSPIMEALQSLVSETPEFSSTQGSRKIVIVSDMLQHSDNLSFYRKQGWNYFVQSNGDQRLAGNLANVSINIIRVPRSGPSMPSRDLSDGFWTRYFDRQGSRPPSVQSLGDL
jgi:hypothetical protein